MDNPIPELTDEQRMQNLRKAAEARASRAKVRKRLKAGDLTLGEALASDDPAITRMPVKVLLQSLPNMGVKRAEQTMDLIGIPRNRRVRGLGSKQAAALLKWGDSR